MDSKLIVIRIKCSYIRGCIDLRILVLGFALGLPWLQLK